MVEDNEFEFDIVVSLPKGADDEDEILDKLFMSGCDDAIVGLGIPGCVGLGFNRTGKDGRAVISDAVKQVLSALPAGSQVREITSDTVGLAGIDGHVSESCDIFSG